MKRLRKIRWVDDPMRFNRRELAKMWRTLKAESGYRKTHGWLSNIEEVSLQQLMDVMERRMEE